MAITYFVPTTSTPTNRNDYNPQVYINETAKQDGWLTPDEWQADYPDAVVTPTFEEAYAQANSALREKRKKVEYGGVMIEGVKWDSESKDELRINSISKLFENGTLTSYEGWKVADGVYITLTPELLQEAMTAFMLHYSACFAVEAAKISEIEAIVANYQEQLDTAASEGKLDEAKEQKILKEAAEALQNWLDTKLNEGWPGE